jgi:hypothetical protein
LLYENALPGAKPSPRWRAEVDQLVLLVVVVERPTGQDHQVEAVRDPLVW